MTYFGFLLRFLVVPILALLLALIYDRRRRLSLPSSLRNLPAWAVVALHVVVAVLYTFPWDNYLVATRVWWYDPNLVTGITLGWVPIEEYTFFVLQTLLTGLWLLWLAPRVEGAPDWAPDGQIRRLAVIVVGLLWLPTPFLLAARMVPATYLALILVWALPPVALQLVFGADILWRYRRLVTAAVLVSTVYLWLADTVAIRLGIWTISSQQTLGLNLPWGLPLEEAIFFLMTNVLISFGITLALAEESRTRLRLFRRAFGMQTDSAEP